MHNNLTKKILHITPHLGGGVGRVLLSYLSKVKNNRSYIHKVACLEYANRNAIEVAKKFGFSLFEKMSEKKQELLDMIADSDIILIHWWNHPLLYDFLVREQLPASRVLMWSHISGFHPPYVFTEKILSYPDLFVFTTPASYKTTDVQNLSEKQKTFLRVVWSTAGVEHIKSVTPKSHKGFNIGYIGTVDYCKMHPDFLNICNQVDIPNAKFIVCGGPKEKELQKEAEYFGIENKFNFTGLVEDINEYLSIFDVFGYPLASYHYGTCDQVLQESMAAGVVPVVLNNQMESYMVKDGLTGIVAKNLNDYIKSLQKLHLDNALRKKLSQNAKEYAINTFSLDNLVLEWEKIFKEVLNFPKTIKKWKFNIKNLEITPKDVFLESLGEYGKDFYSYCNSQNDEEKQEAINNIKILAESELWQPRTRGTVHHYNSFLPNDYYLSIWSNLMTESEPSHIFCLKEENNFHIKRNVLLIVLPYLLEVGGLKSSKLRSFKAFPYGLLSIATYLKTHLRENVNIQIFDCNVNDGRDFISVIKEKLSDFKPDVVGLSMMFDNSYKDLKEISNIIKEHNKSIITVLGGSAATSSYIAIMKEQNNIDGICFYEGEIPLLRLVNSKNIFNFLENDLSWITKKSLSEGRIPQKSLVQNLDEIINIDYNLIDVSKYGMKEAFSPFAGKRAPGKQFFLVTSRGCPFNCVFCMHSSDKDKSMRYASIDAIIKHIKFLISNYDMNILTLYDDQLLFNKKRAKQLFKELAQLNLRIECPNGLSVAYIDEEMAMLMKNAGMDTVNLAIESGSPYVLNKIIHKPLKLERVKSVVQNLRKYGFWIEAFFVSGIPGEKDEHRDETVNFIKEVGLDWSGFSLATPSRGSELFRICLENGYIEKDIEIDALDTTKYIITTPEYSPDYITKKTYLMNLDVNFVNNYRMNNGEYQIAADSFRDVIRRYPNHAFAYYYLSKALKALNENREEVQSAIDKFREIIKNDKIWKEYVDYFKINYN